MTSMQKYHDDASRQGAVVLFDGVCNLCNGAVQFIVRRDARGYFRFASLQSVAGRRLLAGMGQEPGVLASLVLVEAGQVYRRSEAALRIGARLGYPWACVRWLRIVPRPWRDALYDLVARHRYRWFGQRSSCEVPAGTMSDRFLDEGV